MAIHWSIFYHQKGQTFHEGDLKDVVLPVHAHDGFADQFSRSLACSKGQAYVSLRTTLVLVAIFFVDPQQRYCRLSCVKIFWDCYIPIKFGAQAMMRLGILFCRVACDHSEEHSLLIPNILEEASRRIRRNVFHSNTLSMFEGCVRGDILASSTEFLVNIGEWNIS